MSNESFIVTIVVTVGFAVFAAALAFVDWYTPRRPRGRTGEAPSMAALPHGAGPAGAH